MNTDKLQQEINIQVNEEMTTENYRAYDFRLARYIGLEPSIFLTYLCDQDKFINKSKVGLEFYKQKKFIEFFTGLTSTQQTLAIKKLKQLEIIDVVKKGMPAKNYFKINYDKIRKLKKMIINDFYSEIEKYDYYKHEFDSDEEILKNANEKSLNNTSSSHQETLSQETMKAGDILNNKELNNKDSLNILSKDNILRDNTETVVQIAEGTNTKISSNINTNISFMRENSNKEDLDGLDYIPKTPASPPCEEKPKKKKGGLAPLYDMVDKKFPSSKYYNLNAALKTYLKAYVGIRRIPGVDKWEDMLNRLEQYSSVVVSGASGLKFIESRALEIVDKARNGKNGIPYLDFDDVYHSTELKEPTFDLNRDFMKGY